MYATISLLCMGLGNFAFRLSAHVGQNALWSTLIACVAQLVVGALLIGWLKPPVLLQGWALAWPSLAGLLIGGGLFCLFGAFAQANTQPGVAVGIMNANFVVVALLSWLCFGQMLTGKQLIGLLAVLGGLALLV